MSISIHSIRQRPAISEIRFLIKEREQTLFISQWQWARQTIRLIDEIVVQQKHHTSSIQENRKRPSCVRTGSKITTGQLSNNKWGFSCGCWDEIIRDFQTEDKLYSAIRERRQQILDCMESWRSTIQHNQKLDPFYQSLSRTALEQSAQGTYRIESGHLHLSASGISGAYFLSDKKGSEQFVVKPIDEDIGCLNNSKGFSTPYVRSTIRDNMPLYLSSMREALSYEVASQIHVANVAPRTVLAILESSAFHDQIDQIHPDERLRYERIVGSSVHEKLCSVQEFIPNSKTLFDGLQELQASGLSDQEIEARIDQQDFEDANILLWTTYDTDGHLNNFLVYPKSSDAIGNEILGIKKIDNGLTFPEKNEQLRNNLRYLPNANQFLSAAGRDKIAAISIDDLSNQLKRFGLHGSMDALRQRVAVLKELAQRTDLTLREIDSRMAVIGQPNGADRALSPIFRPSSNRPN
jgi:hypothetical protein